MSRRTHLHARLWFRKGPKGPELEEFTLIRDQEVSIEAARPKYCVEGEGERPFAWCRGVRAMAVLLLRNFSPGAQFQLCGDEESLAMTLKNAVREKDGNEWYSRMFKFDDELISSMRNRFNTTAVDSRWKYWVSLGSDWEGAKIEVFLDNREIRTESEVRILADSIEKRDGLSILDISIHLQRGELDAHEYYPAQQMLPLRRGDKLRVRGVLNREALCFLFWITQEGVIQPLFPWNRPPLWSSLPEEVKPLKDFSLPRPDSSQWKVGDRGVGGETLIVIACDEPLNSRMIERLKNASLPHPETNWEKIQGIIEFSARNTKPITRSIMGLEFEEIENPIAYFHGRILSLFPDVEFLGLTLPRAEWNKS